MRLVLKTQSYWIPLMAALFFFIIGASASLALALTNGELSREMRDEAPIPFLMMCAVALVILVVGFSAIWLKGLSERARIMRVVNDAWAKWAQYDSDEAWHDFVEQDYAASMQKLRFPWGTLLALVIIFSLITAYTFTMAGADGANLLIVALPLGAVFSCFLILTLGQVIASRNKVRALHKRRLRSEVPNVYVGKQGMYHEDTGYRTFRSWGERLINVYYQEGKPATVNFQINIDQRYGSYAETVTVSVPRGSESEADRLAHRYFDDGVLKR